MLPSKLASTRPDEAASFDLARYHTPFHPEPQSSQYWKGDHIISVTQKIIEEHMRTIANQKTIDIDVSRLHWTPYGKLDGRR